MCSTEVACLLGTLRTAYEYVYTYCVNPNAEFLNLLLLSLVVIIVRPLFLALVPARGKANPTYALIRDAQGQIQLFDTLKGIAIIAVIVIHATIFFPTNGLISREIALDTIDASMRFAVPIFFIISGILLVPPQKTRRGYTRFFSSKLVRLGIPYVLLSILCTGLYGGSGWTYLTNIFTGHALTPYYFMVVLFQMYLLYPVIEQYAKKRVFVYATLFLAFICQIFPQYLWYWFGVPLVFQYLYFFVWGIYVREQLLDGSFTRNYVPWISMIVLFYTFFVFFPGQYYNVQLYYGVAVFSLLILLGTRTARASALERSLARIGRLSLWIYLTHYVLLEIGLPHLFAYWRAVAGASFVVGTLSITFVSVCFAFAGKYCYDSVYGAIADVLVGTRLERKRISDTTPANQ